MERLHEKGRPGSSGRPREPLYRRGSDTLRALIVFVPFYVYLWRVVEPKLLFHGGGSISDFPSFYTGWGFFREHLLYPGGPATYASAFLSQMFHHSWLGALVIALQALALYLCIAHLLGRAGLPQFRFVGYVPAMLLAILYGRYTYHLPTTMAMLLALAFACAYVTSIQRLRASWIHAPVFAVLSVAAYYIVAGAYLLFLSIVLVYELLAGGKWRRALCFAVVGLALPYLAGVLAFHASPADAYTRLLPISWRVLQYSERSRFLTVVCALYLVAPAAMVAGLAWRRLALERRTGGHIDHSGDSRRAWIGWVVQTLIILGLGVIAAFTGFDRNAKTRLAVDYYAFHRKWPKVLTEARRLPDHRFVTHAVDRALFHTGRLGDEMFRWPQNPASLFLLGAGHDWVHWQCFDVHLDMGLVNLAEHSLTELLEKLGDRPMILQRLATINMVKGNADTARIYLGMLRQTLFHSQWARQYLASLESDPNLSCDEDIQHLRSIALEEDFSLLNVSKERMLLSLLEKNPGNRMAMEYLMARYLLNGQLTGFVQHVGGLKDCGYSELPRYFEEAALLYVYGTRQTLDVAGYAPRAQSHQRMLQLIEVLDRHKGDKRAAFAEMARYHRDTYMFYYLYMRPRRAK